MTTSHQLHLIHIQNIKRLKSIQEKKDMQQHEILHLPCHIKTNTDTEFSIWKKKHMTHSNNLHSVHIQKNEDTKIG